MINTPDVIFLRRRRHVSLVICWIVALLFIVFMCAQSAVRAGRRPLELAPLISDNMVLQQRTSVVLWGKGEPGRDVLVKASWRGAVTGRVNADSTWSVRLLTPGPGGPYELTFSTKDTILSVTNILIGEVWLCSGQSNMEMPLSGWPPSDTILHGPQEIQHALIPDIRLCTVPRAFAPVPESTCGASWVACSPKSVAGFSATAFFFGKKLHEVLHVPVGLIHASWGGTAAESWISARCLATMPEYDSTLQLVAQSEDGRQKIMEWLHPYKTIEISKRPVETRWSDLPLDDDSCSARSFSDSSWRTMRLPVGWESTEVGNFDGVIWFRKEVSIPKEWVGKPLVLSLGPIDDVDRTFVNGVVVGAHEAEGEWKTERVYAIPATVNDSTLLNIAVRVIDYQGGGGIYGDPKLMTVGPEKSTDRVALSGDWKYLPVAELDAGLLYVFGFHSHAYEKKPHLPIDLSGYTPTALYNGMIAPLIPFSLSGVIWYQGESDVANPARYRTLFPLLIDNWRTDFGNDKLPFYFVQIAPYEYGLHAHAEFLREAQSDALGLDNTGMALTIDLGNPANVHPANKQEVGGRLAALALSRTYRKSIPASGPVYVSSKILKSRIEMTFSGTGKGLVVRPVSGVNEFEIAGIDKVFKKAMVTAKGRKVVAWSPEVPHPVAVRYAFRNAPSATLFNSSGWPAPQFRTDDWRLVPDN